MDSSRKRKATNPTPSSNDGGATKKIKLVNTRDVPSPAPTPASGAQEKVYSVGTQLISNLRKSQDKSGRQIALQFLTLPPEEDLPDYYEFTKLPIAIDSIEDKLEANEYNTITEIESDFKRMVQNAKDYNSNGSEIYDDAERIRKLVYNYMKIHNPAYTDDPNYTSFATPIPKAAERTVNGTSIVNGTSRRLSETPARQRKSAQSVPVEAEDEPDADAEEDAEHDSGVDFKGMSLQEAQQTIIEELLKHTDDEGLEVYTPFANLPSRKLEDYYKTIKHPVSLKGLMKRIHGIHGRNERTGKTDFKTWDSFEDAVSWIWRNAQEYNEDGSEMYDLASEFEQSFKLLLENAKTKVEGGAPKIKIGGPKPKVTLNLAHNRPSPSPATQGSVSVDNEALERQRQLVSAGVSGNRTEQRPTTAVDVAARTTSQMPDGTRPPTATAADAVKLEKHASQSPAVNHAVPAPLTNGSMPPPSVRPSSSSPYPNGQPAVSSYQFTAPALLPPVPIRQYPVTEALLPNITLATHPNLQAPSPFKLSVPPHEVLAEHSRTVTLTSAHYFLQISPTVSEELSKDRPYRMFVSINGARLVQRDTVSTPEGLRMHVYDGSLAQGVNRIEVEVAAAKENQKEGLDIEKVIVYANLARA